MTLVDANRTYSLLDLKSAWKVFREEDPDNHVEHHADKFSTELFNILIDSVNGRNDMKIVGMTAGEISRVIGRLSAHLVGCGRRAGMNREMQGKAS